MYATSWNITFPERTENEKEPEMEKQTDAIHECNDKQYWQFHKI